MAVAQQSAGAADGASWAVYDAVLADLEAKRDAITRVIEALRELQPAGEKPVTVKPALSAPATKAMRGKPAKTVAPATRTGRRGGPFEGSASQKLVEALRKLGGERSPAEICAAAGVDAFRGGQLLVKLAGAHGVRRVRPGVYMLAEGGNGGTSPSGLSVNGHDLVLRNGKERCTRCFEERADRAAFKAVDCV